MQKQSEVPDNKVTSRCRSRSSEARGPLVESVHPGTGDIILRPLKVEVVCHRANRHKVWNEGFDVLERRGSSTEHEFVARLPDPL